MTGGYRPTPASTSSSAPRQLRLCLAPHAAIGCKASIAGGSGTLLFVVQCGYEAELKCATFCRGAANERAGRPPGSRKDLCIVVHDLCTEPSPLHISGHRQYILFLLLVETPRLSFVVGLLCTATSDYTTCIRASVHTV